MHEFENVAIVGVMLLLPLLPAMAIFYLLKTRQERLKGRAPDAANGVLNLLGFKMSFEAAGSTATYLTLLGFATFLFLYMADMDRVDREKSQAWLVQVPVYMKDANGRDFPPGSYEFSQIRASVTPYSVVRANQFSLWVIKQDGNFPALNLEISGTPAQVIDLNNRAIAKIQEGHRLQVGPTTITLLAPYAVDGTSPGARPTAPSTTAVTAMARPPVPGPVQ